MTKSLRNIKLLFLAILFLFIALTFHPRFVDISVASDSGRGGILYPFIIVCFIILTIISIIDDSSHGKKLIKYFLPPVVILITALFVYAVFNDTYMLKGDFRAISISMVALYIGYSSHLTNKQLFFLVLFFAIASAYVGIEQVFIRGGGFTIDSYFADSKNQLGPLLITASFSLVAFFQTTRGYYKAFIIGLFVLLVVLTLTIRARAALVAGACAFILLLLEMNKKKGIIGSIIITALLIVIVIILLPGVAKDYIYNSFFSGFNSGDITSGRAERNSNAIEYIINNLSLGHLGNPGQSLPTVHNYLLFKMYQYGVFFSIPILSFYFALFMRSMLALHKISRFSPKYAGFILIVIPYIVSIFEYTFPFGPGTATTFNFVMLGIAIDCFNNGSFGEQSIA